MKVALDTNRYVDLARGDAALGSLLEVCDVIYLPFVVLAELRAAFVAGDQGSANEAVLERFLKKQGVAVLYPREATTRLYARLFLQLRQLGSPIPTNDLWIAALVVEHGLALCTRDRHFERLEQIERI